MRPFAIIYASAYGNKLPSLYFLLFSEKTEPTLNPAFPNPDRLPKPFSLGPFLFGKNRISLLTFGSRELRIEREGDAKNWSFTLDQGSEVTYIDAANPLVFYNLALHTFESTEYVKTTRTAQTLSLARRALDVLANIDPELPWVTDGKIRFQAFLACGPSTDPLKDSAFLKLLEDLRPYASLVLRQDPHERSDDGRFENLVVRARVIFAVLARVVRELDIKPSAEMDAYLSLSPTIDIPLSRELEIGVGKAGPRAAPDAPHLPWLPEEATSQYTGIFSVASSDVASSPPLKDQLSCSDRSRTSPNQQLTGSSLTRSSRTTTWSILLSPSLRFGDSSSTSNPNLLEDLSVSQFASSPRLESFSTPKFEQMASSHWIVSSSPSGARSDVKVDKSPGASSIASTTTGGSGLRRPMSP